MKMSSRSADIQKCRNLRPSDAPSCAALHRASFSNSWSAVEFERLLTDTAIVTNGIGAPGAVSAFVMSRCVADEAEILTIAVAPASRNRGLAGALLGYHLSNLGKAGVSKLFLEVDEANEPALKLYKRYGFSKVGERKGYYTLPGGGRATALVLCCGL